MTSKQELIEEFIEFLKKYDESCEYYETVDTIYVDLNQTLTKNNFVIEVIRCLNPSLLPSIKDILEDNLGRKKSVEQVHKLIKGYPVSELEKASYKASESTPLRDRVKELLPRLYPKRVAIFTEINEVSARAYVKKVICPLYYQSVQIEERGNKIAVVGSFHEELNGILTGDTLAVPENVDRAALICVDIEASLGHEKGVKVWRANTKYPCQPTGLDYIF